ncbi:MAG: class I SAM-dependent methyltransferase [Myxococcales bacterium]|nr:class I SAM-dependent methyltransferase [Myxococcales bacterium]
MSDRDPVHSLDHYRDAAYYDHAYRRYRQDVEHYVDLARDVGGPVLELGGGTGRITVALARAGFDVVMVDQMTSMLERAEARFARESRKVRERVTRLRGDVRDIDVGRRFPLVIAPFNMLQHLYTRKDVERALAMVRAHLAEDGRFGFDVLLPEPSSLVRDPARFYKNRPIKHPRTGLRYDYAEAFEYDHHTQVQTTVIRFVELEGEDVHYDRLVQRQFFPQELEALLHYNGFEVLVHDGGFKGQPIDEVADSQVVVARARPA